MGNEQIYLENEFDNIALINPNKIINSEGFPEDRNIKQEDLVIYANLECNLQPRSRLLVGSDVQRLETVAIATVNFLKPNGQDYLSTRWTELQSNYQDPNYVNAELLGITNIRYRVSSSQSATVDIQLEDVRGRALFESNNNSIYSVFFNLPYPTFYLTMKGYMGKAIQYQLMLMKFQASLDPSSGNFLITLNFQSYKFNVLVDIAWGYLLATPNMYVSQTKQNLQIEPTSPTNSSVSQINGGATPVVTLDSPQGYKKIIQIYDEYKLKKLIPQDFPYLTIQQLIIRLENFQKNLLSSFGKLSVDQLTDSQTFEQILKEFLQIVKTASGTTSWKGEFLDDKKFYIIKDNNNSYYKLFPYKDEITNYQTAESKIAQIIQEYNTKLSEVNTFGEKKGKGNYVIPSPISIKSVTGSKPYVPSISIIDVKQTAIQRTGSSNQTELQKEEANIKKELELLEKKQVAELLARFKPGQPVQDIPVLFRFDGEGFFDGQINYMKTVLNNKSKVIRENLTNDINKIIKSDKGIGFEPTLRNVIAVITASCDAFLRLMDEVHIKAFDNRNNLKKKNSVRNDVKNDPDSPVYPWPQYSKEINVDGLTKFDLKYPGDPEYIDDSGANDVNAWPEVEFVEEFIKGYIKRQQLPISPTPQSNEDTTIKRLCLAGFDTPSNVVFSNYQEIYFLYEIIERIETIIQYQGFLRDDNSFGNILNFLQALEASNVIISLGSDNVSLTYFIKNLEVTNYIDYLSFLKSISNQGNGTLWQKYSRGIPTSEYLKNEINNPSKILSKPLPNIFDSLVTEENANEVENSLVKYLESTKNSEIIFTDRYPFISESWNKLNLKNGLQNFSTRTVLNTNKTLFYNSKVKKIVNYLDDFTDSNPGDNTKIKPFNFFVSLNQEINLVDANNNFLSFYLQRTESPKKSFYTEGSIINTPFNVNIALTTSSILNTPFFIKSIQNGVENLKGGSEYPFLQSSYFFLNSLPLSNFKSKYIDIDGNERDYIGPTFTKFGAIHRMPKLLICKIGSVWHRYKTWIDTGNDILSSAMGSFNFDNSFDPVNNNPSSNYNIVVDGEENFIQFKNSVTSDDGTMENINVGFYPKVLNDFQYFLNDENLYSSESLINQELQTMVDNRDVLLVSNSQSQINKSYGYNLSNPSLALSYKTTSVLLKSFETNETPVDGNFYFSAPSFGSRYTQVQYECFTGANAVPDVYNNEFVYNGSLRFFWGGTHFGYFPTVNQLCKPDQYVSRTATSLWPWVLLLDDNGENSSVDSIEDLFSVFTKEELDLFEEEYKKFSRSKFQSENDFNIQSLLRKALLVNENDFFNDNSNLLIEDFQTAQLKNFNIVIDDYINRNSLFQKGNPTNFNLINLRTFSEKNFTGKTSYTYYKETTPTAIPTSSNTQTWANSELEYAEAWKNLKTYVGFSEVNGLKYQGVNSYITDFFIDLNVAFTSENIIKFADEIKIYASRKLVNSGETFNFKQEVDNFLGQITLKTNNFFNGALLKMKKGLPTVEKKGKVEDSSPIEGELSKLQYYNNFKAINDKWVAGNNYNSETLLEDILFLDRAGRDIGDKIYINVLDLVSGNAAFLKGRDVASNAYSAIGGIIEYNHFKIFNMPSYINFYGVQNVGDTQNSGDTTSHPFATNLFGTFTDVDYQNSKSKMVCVYTETGSEHTDNQSPTNGFLDDSFNLGVATNNPNLDNMSNKDDYAISNKCVGFAVDFGLQNQGVFKEINVSQESGQATAESLKQIYDMANLYSGTKSSSQSVSLYNIYTTRSYKATVTAMGNAMIQPTMYFVLRNVPLFAGPYYIDSVEHTISNNNFTTQFTGTRQKLFTPPLENKLLETIKTTFLNELINNQVQQRQGEVRIEQTTIQVKNKLSNSVTSQFKPSTVPICQTQPEYQDYSVAKPTELTETIDSMWKKVRERILQTPLSGSNLDYVVYTIFYVNSFDGDKFSFYNNNVSLTPIGTGVPTWGGGTSGSFNKEYICLEGNNSQSQAFVTFSGITNCVDFNILRYEETFKTALDNIGNEDIFVSGFTKSWIERYPYDNTRGTTNLYDQFVATNQNEFDLLNGKVRKAYKIVKGYLSQ